MNVEKRAEYFITSVSSNSEAISRDYTISNQQRLHNQSHI